MTGGQGSGRTGRKDEMSDIISREDTLDAIQKRADEVDSVYSAFWEGLKIAQDIVEKVPSAEPEIIRCKDCRYYDPAHVEKDGKRFEYSEFPKEAFCSFDNHFVSMAYGINVGGKCKYETYGTYISVFRSEDDYCSKAWRKEEE